MSAQGEKRVLQLHWWYGRAWQIKSKFKAKQTFRKAHIKRFVLSSLSPLKIPGKDCWAVKIFYLTGHLPTPLFHTWTKSFRAGDCHSRWQEKGAEHLQFINLTSPLLLGNFPDIYVTGREREGVYGKYFHSWALLREKQICLLTDIFHPSVFSGQLKKFLSLFCFKLFSFPRKGKSVFYGYLSFLSLKSSPGLAGSGDKIFSARIYCSW